MGRGQCAFLVAASLIIFVGMYTTIESSFLSSSMPTPIPNDTPIQSPPPTSSTSPNASSHDPTPPLDPPSHYCKFRSSSLYRSIYVYESPPDKPYPWIAMASKLSASHAQQFAPRSPLSQFALEVVVHAIITHPNSCLQSDDPTTAKLFYVPFFSDIEFREGTYKREITPHGKALRAAILGDYTLWESTWHHPSTYWHRHNGADHIVVMAAPLTGLSHESSRRGSYHYIHTQHQIDPPIIISTELSASFVETYPQCAAKNIPVPYPNHDGIWFNGSLKSRIAAAFPAPTHHNRGVYMFYRGGSHGECLPLRSSLKTEFSCSTSQTALTGAFDTEDIAHEVGLNSALFCPCPHGDSPSAKRMYDAVVAGCIPVVLSTDFGWSLTTDVDLFSDVGPEEFAVRIPSEVMKGGGECESMPVHDFLASLGEKEIERLLAGVEKAGKLFAYYKEDKDMTETLLSDKYLPDGGASEAIVRELEKRVGGERWRACERERSEVAKEKVKEPNKFVC